MSASPSSSTSSFVPVAYKEDAIQVINELKLFNPDLLPYIDLAHGQGDISDNYHIVSVFGSQSTGKSTLLNKLFNTNFDVMDEHKRQQTTKGIWMAHSPVISSNNKKTLKGEVFVMDVEGTDGRERGEDQDFERKSALFAISTSEVLILNIWETQVGLYQGANMGLLKTVFEVNLSLFGASKLTSTDSHKVLLLIVVRDHLGNTPLSNLLATLKHDLVQMWDELNKPSELQHLKFEDFFDIDFHALHHKVLQFAEFEKDVKLLGDRFTNDNEIFKANYHHNIPIDGWTMYAENCWDQINNNKDLDLPTQQILVAKFKCDEILTGVFEDFVENYKFKLSDQTMIEIVDEYLEQYDSKASRYNNDVYEGRKVILQDKIHDVLHGVYHDHRSTLEHELTTDFSEQVAVVSVENFCRETLSLIEHFQSTYFQKLQKHKYKRDQLFESDWGVLSKNLDLIVDNQRSIELNSIVNKSVKKVNNQMTKLINFEVNNVGETTWENIFGNFEKYKTDVFKKYQTSENELDFGLGTSDSVNSSTFLQFNENALAKIYATIKSIVNKNTLGSIMKERFEDTFRYDESGLPRMYMNVTELDEKFSDGKSSGYNALEVLKEITVEIGDVPIEDDDDEDDDENSASIIIKEADSEAILKKYKKEIDTQYLETKRAMIQSRSHIPYYVYLVILVLGWNEMMIVLRNPLLITLCILLGGGIYVLYALNLVGPAQIVAVRLLEEVSGQVKDWVRELVKEETVVKSAKGESIEMEAW